MKDTAHAKAIHEVRRTLVELICTMADDDWGMAFDEVKWAVEAIGQEMKWTVEMAGQDTVVRTDARPSAKYVREARHRCLDALDALARARVDAGDQ